MEGLSTISNQSIIKNQETYSEERTVAVKRQDIEVGDSKALLINLTLRTGEKGIIEIDPLQYTLNQPDDGTKPHYGIDADDIDKEEEQSFEISMAIDLRRAVCK